jgi:hypothetical protein
MNIKLTVSQREAFERIRCGGIPNCKWSDIDVLIAAGLIERSGYETRRDAMGVYHTPNFVVKGEAMTVERELAENAYNCKFCGSFLSDADPAHCPDCGRPCELLVTEAMIDAGLEAHAKGAPFESPFGERGSFAVIYRAMRHKAGL